MYGNWMNCSLTSKAGVGYIAWPWSSDTDPKMAPFVCRSRLLLAFPIFALIVQKSLICLWGHDLWVNLSFLHQLKSDKRRELILVSQGNFCIFCLHTLNYLISKEETDLKRKKTFREIIEHQVSWWSYIME